MTFHIQKHYRAVVLTLWSIAAFETAVAVIIDGDPDIENSVETSIRGSNSDAVEWSHFSKMSAPQPLDQIAYSILGPVSYGGQQPQLLLEDPKKGSPAKSGETLPLENAFSLFGIALWALGLAICFLGLLSLSFEKRTSDLNSEEFLNQFRIQNLLVWIRNISKNWGVKKDATWSVIMGLCSIVAGLADWAFL